MPGALCIDENSCAKLQKVAEMAKYFLKKLSTNYYFGKLFKEV